MKVHVKDGFRLITWTGRHILLNRPASCKHVFLKPYVTLKPQRGLFVFKS